MWGIPAADAVYAWDRPSLDPVLRSLSGALFPRRTTALRPSSPASMAEVVGLACEGPTNAAFSELPLILSLNQPKYRSVLRQNCTSVCCVAKV